MDIKSFHQTNRERLCYNITRNFSPYLDIIILLLLLFCQCSDEMDISVTIYSNMKQELIITIQ
jgi:hypothetical protein